MSLTGEGGWGAAAIAAYRGDAVPEQSVAGRSKQQGQEGLSREGKDILPACEDIVHRGTGILCSAEYPLVAVLSCMMPKAG